MPGRQALPPARTRLAEVGASRRTGSNVPPLGGATREAPAHRHFEHVPMNAHVSARNPKLPFGDPAVMRILPRESPPRVAVGANHRDNSNVPLPGEPTRARRTRLRPEAVTTTARRRGGSQYPQPPVNFHQTGPGTNQVPPRVFAEKVFRRAKAERHPAARFVRDTRHRSRASGGQTRVRRPNGRPPSRCPSPSEWPPRSSGAVTESIRRTRCCVPRCASSGD